MSGVSLIERLKRGDKSAIREWYLIYSVKLRNFFIPKVRTSHDVDELIHDTFLSCLKSLPLFRGEAGFYGWMLSIARHELADYYRKLYAKRVISALPLGEKLLAAANETSAHHERVVEVLSKLPVSVSELLALKYVDNLSVEHIALELALSPHAVQGRLYRARNVFKKLFKELNEKN